MRILRPGKLPKKQDIILVGICKNCYAKVECFHTDSAILPYSRSNPIFKIPCPTSKCNCIITLNEFTDPLDEIFNEVLPPDEYFMTEPKSKPNALWDEFTDYSKT